MQLSYGKAKGNLSTASKKIMRSLGLPDYTAPPPLPKSSPAAFEQYCLDELPDYDTFDA